MAYDPRALAAAAVAFSEAARARQRRFAFLMPVIGMSIAFAMAAAWHALGVTDPHPYPF